MSTSSGTESSGTSAWTSQRLGDFLVKMQLRLIAILKAKPGRPDDFPDDPFYVDNLRGEMIFSFNVLGHAVLIGTPPPPTYTYMLRRLTYAFEKKDTNCWKALMRTADKVLYMYGTRDVPDDLPFPRWWEDDPLCDCDLSTWITANFVQPAGHGQKRLEKDVAAIMGELSQLSDGIDGQMAHTHEYLAAAAEDVEISSREWASAHSAVRSQAGMATMDLPLTTKFV